MGAIIPKVSSAWSIDFQKGAFNHQKQTKILIQMIFFYTTFLITERNYFRKNVKKWIVSLINWSIDDQKYAWDNKKAFLNLHFNIFLGWLLKNK